MRAEQLEKAYRWDAAGNMYDMAVKLNPLDDETMYKAGTFKIRQSKKAGIIVQLSSKPSALGARSG